MESFRVICYCISHICMMGFLFVFTRRRYSPGRTAGLLAVSAAGLILLELLGAGDLLPQGLVVVLQIFIMQGSSLMISEYRDARGLFTGLCASNYVLPGVMVCLYLHVLTGWMASLLVLEVVIHLLVLEAFSHSLLPVYRVIQMEKKEQWLVMCLMPSLFYLSAMGLDLAVRGSNKPVMALLTMVFFLLTLYAFYLLIFRMILRLRQDQQAVKEREILSAGIRALQWEAAELRETEQKITEHLNERRELMHAMAAELVKQDYEAAGQILVQMQDMTEVRQSVHYCNNAPVNGVMVYYASEALAQDTALSVQMDFPERLRVSDWELAVVVGNLMDNALLACQKIPDKRRRQIHVTARTVHSQFLLEIRNTFLEPVVFSPENGLPLSGRGENHGIGVNSVAYFAEKNQVLFDCGTEAEEFYARLLI